MAARSSSSGGGSGSAATAPGMASISRKSSGAAVTAPAGPPPSRFSALWAVLTCKKGPPEEPPHRVAHLNHSEVTAKDYGDNVISTAKYSVWSFVPRSLFEQ